MKIKKRLLYFFILLFLVGCSNPRKLKWEQDIDFFSDMLYKKQLDFKETVDEEDFHSDLKELKKKVNGLMDYEVVLELQSTIAKLNIAHTNVDIFYSGITHFPIYTEVFDDGLFIVGISNSRMRHLKEKIVRINDIPIDNVYEKISPLISSENEYWVKNKLPYLMSSPEILSFCQVLNNADTVTYHLENGEEISFNVNEDYRNTQTTFVQPLMNSFWLKNQNTNYWFRALDPNTLYLQYNSCEEDPTYPFDKFVAELGFVLNTFTINKLCFDLRLNEGGNSDVVKPLINRLKQEKGLKIYTLISRRTYSSGTFAVADCKNELSAVLVGEPTGGSPNSYGEVSSFALPNSAVEVNYTTKHFTILNTPDPFISPDIKIDYLSEPYLNGNDPVLEYVLND